MFTFFHLLILTLVVTTKNNLVWFALTYWLYLQTQSVIATSIFSGMFLLLNAVSGIWFGSLVDHHYKKQSMLWSNIITTIFFVLAVISHYYLKAGSISVGSPLLWLIILFVTLGIVVGNIFGIASSTMVTLLVPADQRDKANGKMGTAMGISFALTSVASGIALNSLGISGVFLISIFTSLIVIAFLSITKFPQEPHLDARSKSEKRQVDVLGTIKLIKSIPGLFSLVFFTSMNNLLGGVFMSLMDAYGLTLVSVQIWGILWGFISLAFILSGIYISRRGLGDNPLKTMFQANIIIWISSIFFTVQPSIVLLTVGSFIWMALMPFIEATESTVLQRVVPHHRQGRVFGFAHTVEQSASPLISFIIGPIAQYIFIPFMTTGAGVDLIGNWFGVGPGRGIALVFIITGVIGLIITLRSMSSVSYKLLNNHYQNSK